MKKLVFTIKPIAFGTVQLFSWIEGQKTKTYYFHGEFDNIKEITISAQARKEELGAMFELGEYRY